MKLADSLPSFFSPRRKTPFAPRPAAIIEPLEAPIAPATFTWINAGSGAWETAGNWSVSNGTDANGIPDADDDVTIYPATLVTVTISSGQAALSISAPDDDAAAALFRDKPFRKLLRDEIGGGDIELHRPVPERARHFEKGHVKKTAGIANERVELRLGGEGGSARLGIG